MEENSLDTKTRLLSRGVAWLSQNPRGPICKKDKLEKRMATPHLESSPDKGKGCNAVGEGKQTCYLGQGTKRGRREGWYGTLGPTNPLVPTWW